ncbi:bifunctional 3'-5' exonuclease/DNA polymerase [Microbacterium flavum]|uniref:DNA-directed DNA polymerase n=1 Tax=Microbacterium flavum TaxID=415216 RepID=A0ABS5XRL2_9MICO|nr:bifunctional 3'-5' exonuclease/DNA polymerase [Microbacterium flavum]MBT8797164.1 bifunctional 3'-5' exonuclease/DNA polymerase [Microbacterium flavum]
MTTATRWRVVGTAADTQADALCIVDLDADLVELGRIILPRASWPAAVAEAPAPDAVRWVWSDTARWYRGILEAGATVARCHDLRLCHAILRTSAWTGEAAALRDARDWDAAASEAGVAADDALFDLEDVADAAAAASEAPHAVDAALAEFRRQIAAVAASVNPGRLTLLLAAESAGALLAAEMHAAGLPWSRAVHEAILEEVLGARPAPGEIAPRVRDLAVTVRRALGDPTASLDSQPKLLRSLHRVGVLASSTSRWELARYDHPVIEPLLRYKKLTRLVSANGWAWLDEWASEGRFRPVYVPGGVVTGRWASSGGGALQLPRQLRPAVRADEGWTLVVADVAQLEPRVLAAMSGDLTLAGAARGADLYDGIVARGVVGTRQEAKIAMLGAMYGATTGDSGRLVPALRRAYPRAMGLVDDAARVGAGGGVVTTWLGRSSPAPSPDWRTVQDAAGAPEATEGDRARARRSAANRGRFTRNFVVQGTAAEWALAWLADLRRELRALPDDGDGGGSATVKARASGPAFAGRAHLCFFLHDEIIVHAPLGQAEVVADLIRCSAVRATHLLFGGFPIDFPLDLRITPDAAKG